MRGVSLRLVLGWVLLAAGGAACAQIAGAHFDDVHARDAGNGAVCAPTTPFGAPVLIPLDSGTWGAFGLWSLRLTADHLTAYFTAQWGLWRVMRPTADVPFDMASAIALITPIDPTMEDWAPTVSGDGSVLFYASGVVSGGSGFSNWRIFGATVVGQSLGASVEVPSLNMPDQNVLQTMPYLLPDGKVIYFSSTRLGGWDIFRAERETISGDFGSPQAVSSINTGAQEKAAVVSPDELTIYFSSDIGDRKSNIFVATRASPGDNFGPPVRHTELEIPQSESDSYPDWISEDGCTLYLHYSDPAAVFVATRSP
jgi:hypothetical protein